MSKDERKAQPPTARKSNGDRTRRTPATGAQRNYSRQQHERQGTKLRAKPANIGKRILFTAFNAAYEEYDDAAARNEDIRAYILDHYNAQLGCTLDVLVTGFILGYSAGMEYSDLLDDDNVNIRDVLNIVLDRKGVDHDIQ